MPYPFHLTKHRRRQLKHFYIISKGRIIGELRTQGHNAKEVTLAAGRYAERAGQRYLDRKVRMLVSGRERDF